MDDLNLLKLLNLTETNAVPTNRIARNTEKNDEFYKKIAYDRRMHSSS